MGLVVDLSSTPERAIYLGFCGSQSIQSEPWGRASAEPSHLTVKVAYFDCIAGISGDMALAALIDAGADPAELKEQLTKLPLEPFDVQVEETESQGIRAVRVATRVATAGVIRTYPSIRALLDAADLPERPKQLAMRIFHRLAEAEARVHRKEIDVVTFHESEAVDSMVCIVGTALALSSLGIRRSFSSAVPTGLGMTRTEHGMMPIPTPAVVELLRGAPLYSRGVPVELVTATGAAILATVVEGYGEIPPMRIDAVGYGAGAQRLDFPNVLRVLVGEEVRLSAGEERPAERAMHLVADEPEEPDAPGGR